MSTADSVNIGAILAQQGLVNLGQFTGIAIQPGLTGRAQGSNLALDAYPSPEQAALALAQTDWQIDPIAGDDAASGLPGAPLKTFAEVVRRWGTSSPSLSQDTYVRFLNDAPDFTDPISVSPTLNGCYLYFVGTPKAVITDTISVFTPLNRAAGTDNLVTGTIITDFSPYAGMMMRVALATLATRSVGTAPPAATFTGAPLVACEPLQVNITKAGALGAAEFAWFLNGVLQATGIVTAASILLGATGVTINFPAGAYNTSQTYTTSSAAYCWIDPLSGDLNPGTDPIGPTTPVSATMALGKPIGASGVQWAGVRLQAYGTAAPAASFTGIPQAKYFYLKVEITTGGVVGVARFKWSINGVEQANNVLTSSVVTLGTTGLVANFPAGTYQTNNVYTATTTPSYDGPDWGPPPNMQALTAGLSFTIFQPTKVFAVKLDATLEGGSTPLVTASCIRAQDLWMTAPNTPPLGFPGMLYMLGSFAQISHCRLDGFFLRDKYTRLFCGVNNFYLGGMFANSYWVYGGVLGAHGPVVAGGAGAGALPLTFDGDTILHFTPSPYLQPLVFGTAHVKSGAITCRNNGDVAITPNGRGIFYNAATPGGATALWGACSVALRDGKSFRIVNTAGVTATSCCLFTGAPSVTIDGISAAGFPLAKFDPGTGTFLAGPATTPLATLVAALDAGAPLSGDTFAIQNPHTGTRVVMNGNNNFS